MNASRRVVGDMEIGAPDDSESLSCAGKAVPIMELNDFCFMMLSKDQEDPK
jgi:hypothetical protein